MPARKSKRLYVGELIPDKRGRGQRVPDAKAYQEEFRRVIAVEMVARLRLEGASVKDAIRQTACATHRNDAALLKAYKQEARDALPKVATDLCLAATAARRAEILARLDRLMAPRTTSRS